ncbi:MAG TPA: ferrochelatase [Mycobacteriales bacterium]|nr:ferrochelatase [Mycobacteriales bacterium]
MAQYDALLLLSFGGPEGPADVLPFLENVVRGRGVPRERLLAVVEHYQHFDGVSPINAQNRALLAALRAELDIGVYWGNRNWYPYVEDAVREMAAAGVTRALAFATSGYSSYSGCRQYWEDLDRARAAAGPTAPTIDKLRHFYNHPGFIEPNADAVRAALAELPAPLRAEARLVFTAHSIPVAMNDAAGPERNGWYAVQVAEAARLVTELVRPGGAFDVVWQSRSGPPRVPWLGPDINDHLTELAGQGAPAVVVSPVGFVSDHVEVAWDLDHEARETAAGLGLAYARAATVGVHPRFVRMIVELVAERQSGAPRLAFGRYGPSHDVCPAGCCPAPARRPSL